MEFIFHSKIEKTTKSSIIYFIVQIIIKTNSETAIIEYQDFSPIL